MAISYILAINFLLLTYITIGQEKINCCSTVRSNHKETPDDYIARHWKWKGDTLRSGHTVTWQQ